MIRIFLLQSVILSVRKTITGARAKNTKTRLFLSQCRLIGKGTVIIGTVTSPMIYLMKIFLIMKTKSDKCP